MLMSILGCFNYCYDNREEEDEEDGKDSCSDEDVLPCNRNCKLTCESNIITSSPHRDCSANLLS